MRKTLIYSLFLLLVLTQYACKKNKWRQDIAGPKVMSRYQWIKMDKATGEFSQVIYDTSNMAELILWDYSSDSYNDVYYYGKVYPASWAVTINGVGARKEPISWYSDEYENESFTFWSEPPTADPVCRATYTMKKKSGGVIELTGVFTDGSNNYKEVIELSPKKSSDL